MNYSMFFLWFWCAALTIFDIAVIGHIIKGSAAFEYLMQR